MADGVALRSRRSRAHHAGEHALCLRRNCPHAPAERPGSLPAGQEPDPGCASSAVPVSDPAAELRQLAGDLAAAYRADPGNALLARELRMTLQALMAGAPEKSVDRELEELAAALRT